jgi:hypothetical protein
MNIPTAAFSACPARFLDTIQFLLDNDLPGLFHASFADMSFNASDEDQGF